MRDINSVLKTNTFLMSEVETITDILERLAKALKMELVNIYDNNLEQSSALSYYYRLQGKLESSGYPIFIDIDMVTYSTYADKQARISAIRFNLLPYIPNVKNSQFKEYARDIENLVTTTKLSSDKSTKGLTTYLKKSILSDKNLELYSRAYKAYDSYQQAKINKANWYQEQVKKLANFSEDRVVDRDREGIITIIRDNKKFFITPILNSNQTTSYTIKFNCDSLEDLFYCKNLSDC